MILNLPIGIMGSNCILIYDETSKTGAVIDPGILDVTPLERVRRQHNIDIVVVLNTHGHFDHTAGNHLMPTTAKLAIHPADVDLLLSGGSASLFGLHAPPSPEPAFTFEDGDTLSIGTIQLRVMHTPGHTLGSVSFYCAQEKTVITGDTLFQGSVGRTDLPGGNEQQLLNSLESYLLLPEETIVIPGHGPTSTLREEKSHNPWLRYVQQR